MRVEVFRSLYREWAQARRKELSPAEEAALWKQMTGGLDTRLDTLGKALQDREGVSRDTKGGSMKATDKFKVDLKMAIESALATAREEERAEAAYNEGGSKRAVETTKSIALEQKKKLWEWIDTLKIGPNQEGEASNAMGEETEAMKKFMALMGFKSEAFEADSVEAAVAMATDIGLRAGAEVTLVEVHAVLPRGSLGDAVKKAKDSIMRRFDDLISDLENSGRDSKGGPMRQVMCYGAGLSEAFESDSLLQAVAKAKQIANDNGKTVRLMEVLAVLPPDERREYTQAELVEATDKINRVYP